MKIKIYLPEYASKVQGTLPSVEVEQEENVEECGRENEVASDQCSEDQGEGGEDANVCQVDNEEETCNENTMVCMHFAWHAWSFVYSVSSILLNELSK